MMQLVMLQGLSQKIEPGSSAAIEQRLREIEAKNEAENKALESSLLDLIGAVGEQVMNLKNELFAAVGIY